MFEPSSKYEGKFELTLNKGSDPESDLFALSDLNKELAASYPKNSYHSYSVLNDSFNINSRNKVKVIVECSKKIYDSYNNKWNLKGEWQPPRIEARIVLRDNQ